MQLSVRWELLSVLLVIVFSLSIWNILWIPWLAWVWQCSPDSSLACSNPPYLSLPNVRTILYGSLDVSFLLKLWFCLFPFMCGIHIWIHVCVWGMLTCVCADGGQMSTPRALSGALHLTFWDRSSHWGWAHHFRWIFWLVVPPCLPLLCWDCRRVLPHPIFAWVLGISLPNCEALFPLSCLPNSLFLDFARARLPLHKFSG